MPVILMLNLKGGVAKTTNCVAIAEGLADSGKRVLVIDADHQCMAGELLLGQERMLLQDHRKKTLHDLLAAMWDDDFSEERIDAFIASGASNIGGGYENLDVIPCSIRIDDFQTNMARARRGFATRPEFNSAMKRGLGALWRYANQNYDLTLVDCPPSIAIQVHQLLRIADAFIVPCVPDRLSVRGAFWLLDRMNRLGLKRIQPLGTLWSLYRTQSAMHHHFVEETARGREPLDRLPRPFKNIVPTAAAIARSTEPDTHPSTYSAKYTPAFAQLYQRLCREVFRRARQLEREKVE